MGRFLRRHLCWPADHGTWAFLLSPLTIGLVLGGRLSVVTLYLVVAVAAGFLVRQPATVAVKALAGRRGRSDLVPALAWTALYGAVGGAHAVGLALRGYHYLLWLAVPGLAVFCWYLLLVARRAERRQVLLEILAAGVLALSAPAGLWAGLGEPVASGWLLWLLTWAHSSASILLVYLRLGQRSGARREDSATARRALASAWLPLLAVLTGSLAGWLPRWLFLAYSLQPLEAVRFTRRPEPGARPAAIGLRQFAVTALHTAIFLAAWR